MSIKVAINGFGRIGRCTLRAIYEQGLQNEFEVVAINASGDLATNAHLLKYDTTHGRFATPVDTEGDSVIIIDGKKIPFYSTKDPKGVDWGSHGVEVLLECTGAYTTKAKAQALLDQGARRVLISAPGGDDVDTTIVMGVNEEVLRAGMTVVSNASCTTNCLAPFADMPEVLQRLRRGLLRNPGGDRVMAQVLAIVLSAGLDAVLVAIELALESGPPGKVSVEHVVNVLNRLNAQPVPPTAATLLRATTPPLANTARYDSLRSDTVGAITEGADHED